MQQLVGYSTINNCMLDLCSDHIVDRTNRSRDEKTDDLKIMLRPLSVYINLLHFCTAGKPFNSELHRIRCPLKCVVNYLVIPL